MENNQQVVKKLFTIKKNSITMLRKRGYNIEQEAGIYQLDVYTFARTYISAAEQNETTLRKILNKVYENAQGERLISFFADLEPGKKSIGVSEVRTLVEQMERYKIRNAIFISPVGLGPAASKEIKALLSYNIQVFLEAEMMYDPTEHILVPKHIPLTDEQQREFLNKNQIDFDKLPIIKSDDIIVRYYGLKPGRVIKIERFNMHQSMTENTISFRAVQE